MVSENVYEILIAIKVIIWFYNSNFPTDVWKFFSKCENYNQFIIISITPVVLTNIVDANG